VTRALVVNKIQQHGCCICVDDNDALHAPVRAVEQVSTFGIMPPEIVPRRSLARSLIDSSGNQFFGLSSTRATSVRSSRRWAFSAPATAPAKVSAVMFSVCPSSRSRAEPAPGSANRRSAAFQQRQGDLGGGADEAESIAFSMLESG